MSEILKRLLAEGKLRRHRTSAREIADLLGVVDRDLADAHVQEVSADRRFAIAYEAALQLATITVYASGYETQGPGHHGNTFQALKETMGATGQNYADYFDVCRSKRSTASYDRAGEISETEVASLTRKVETFKGDVLSWLRKNHADLAVYIPDPER
jgi:uncharacterized protein (UPF0332 family)